MYWLNRIKLTTFHFDIHFSDTGEGLLLSGQTSLLHMALKPVATQVYVESDNTLHRNKTWTRNSKSSVKLLLPLK